MLSFKDELPDQEKQVFLLKPFYLGILTNSLKVSAALSIQPREAGVTRKLLVYPMCLCSFQVASYRSYCLVPWDTTLSGILQERSPTGMKEDYTEFSLKEVISTLVDTLTDCSSHIP